MLEEKPEHITPLQAWVLATRPKTLPAAAAPVIVGTAAAIFVDKFSLGPAIAAFLVGQLLQIGANVSNDYFDFFKGADTEKRLGPVRVTQAGLLSPKQVFAGMWVIFGLAALIGIYLTWVAGWPVVAIGLAAIVTAIFYTGGPLPFGYYGLGEVFVFIFFGLVATGGTYFVQAGWPGAVVWWSALPMGFLIVDILVVNNLRDIDTDREAGKLTLAARMGPRWAQGEYVACLAAAYLTPLVMALLNLAPWWVMVSWLSLPLAYRLVRTILTVKGRPLNQALAGTGQLTLVYGLLFSAGLIFGKVF